MITSKTSLWCVIGNPVSHSLSPIMQNAAFAASGLDAVFTAIAPKNLRLTMEDLKSKGVQAIAVTLPYKIDALKFADEIDRSAEEIGAANAIILEQGKYVAYNFDGRAAIKALEEVIEIHSKTVGIIGAGGAAHAIAYELSLTKNRVILFARTPEKAKRISDSFHLNGYHGLGHAELLSFCDVIINTTPIGMKGIPDKTIIPESCIQRHQTIFDIVYTPMETHLIKIAKSKGANVVYGYKMLLYGGILLFEKVTGQKAPAKAMESALRKELMHI